jgi:molybdate transport system substrate-binding protein
MRKLSLLALYGLLLCNVPARADEVTVSAAASLKDVLTRLRADYSKVRPGTGIRFNFGSSGTLQRQIEAGAPVDIFISAADKNMNALVATDEVDASSRRLLARGELVLIAPRGSKLKSIVELRQAKVRTLALGGPGVPAGDYARQTLKALRLSETVSDKIVLGKDVRSVLTLVAAGNADAGFVYRTDALTSKQVRIVAVAPPKSHSPVRYPMAIVTGAPNRAGANRFRDYLVNPAAKRVLKQFGFR